LEREKSRGRKFLSRGMKEKGTMSVVRKGTKRLLNRLLSSQKSQKSRGGSSGTSEEEKIA